MATQQDNIGTEPPSSSSSGSNHTYHAFLCFRGADVRYDFGDWLYNELVRSGLYTFRDDDDIQRGLDFEPEIEKAIRESKVAVIIFSKDLASSSYCLDEIAMFMERRERKEVQVLPVFFKVDPEKLSEVYAASFEKHEDKLESLQGEELQVFKRKLDGWRNAILQVAGITGHHAYEIGYQSEFIRGVVDDARRLANVMILDIPSHVVGKPHRFIHLHVWVKNESHDKRIALLHGAHGIGKKTIVAVVSNKNYRDFDATAFFDKVGENSKPSDGIVKLQRQLLSRLRNHKGKSNITSESQGTAEIKAALRNKRVLIVLADLDQADQFFKMIPGPEYLERGSKVIVTSVNENLLGNHFCVKFCVEPLVPILSLELFSWHAFGTPRPPIQGSEKLVMAALRYCCGIPLALERFASFSSSLGMDHWDGLVPDINEDPKLINNLEQGFATLKMDDKKLFFDIACFYAGSDLDHVDSVLNMYMEGGFDRLRSRHLVSVDSENKVTMDQPTIEMGREIIRRKTVFVEELSNIFSPVDAIELFRECNGTKHIRSLILDGKEVPASSAIEMEFKTEAFTGMTKLKLLQLVDVQLEGDFEDFPKGLVWLSFAGMSLPLFPDDNSLKYLVVLELHNCTVKLWNEGRSLTKLKILNLSCSPMLVKTPDFTRLHVPNLERLILDDCTGLVEIDSSIQVLASLVLLSLQRCHNLKELPTLGSLVRLNISGCITLHAVPNKRIESVKELSAQGIAMDRFVAESAAYSFSAVFPCLVKLNLCKCNLSDEKVIDDLVKLPSLEVLDLSQNLFTAMPEALGAFLSLISLSLHHCEHLKEVRKLPSRLENLNVWHCTSLEKIDGIVRPNMVLCAAECVNLVQIGKATIFEAATDESITAMKDLKLYDLDSSAESDGFEMANTCTGVIRKTLVQKQELVFHCGTLNLFARGSKVPEGYEHGVEDRMFLITPEAGRRIIGINLCVLYRTRGKYTNYPIRVLMCVQNGDSKRLMWMHIPLAYAIASKKNEYMMWFSHWRLTGQIEAGDTLFIQVKPATDDVEVISYGIRLATEDEEEQAMSKSMWYQKLDVDWSTYEERPGFFNIGNNSHRGNMKADYHYGGHYFGNLPESDIL